MKEIPCGLHAEDQAFSLLALSQKVLEELDLLASVTGATAWDDGSVAVLREVLPDFLGSPGSPLVVDVLGNVYEHF
jgi:hypothetical protein